MSSEKRYVSEGFKGDLEVNGDQSIFTFIKGNPHANVMPFGVVPSMYVATIGGKVAMRYAWDDEFTYDKELKAPKNMKLKNTSALLFHCVLTILKEGDNFCVKTWKENMHLILPQLTNYATAQRIRNATSGALRSLVKQNYIRINESTGVATPVKHAEPAEAYGVFVNCREWLYSGEGGVTAGPYKSQSPDPDKMDDQPSLFDDHKDEPQPKYDQSDVVEEPVTQVTSLPSKARVIGQGLITLQDLLAFSTGSMDLYGVNGSVVFKLEPKSVISIENGEFFGSVNNSEEVKEISIEKLYKDPMEAMKSASLI